MNKQELTNAKKWATQTHNKEDFNTRTKMSISCLSTQINQILIEERRLKDNYRRALKEAQDHRRNCEQGLIRLYRERNNENN